MKNIAVFASGRGTNFSAIARAVRKGIINANLALLVCDRPGAPVIAKARRARVKVVLVKRKDFSSPAEFDSELIGHLEENKIDLIVLAGFMLLLSREFVEKYKGRIINIHPALLPSFKGAHGIKEAFDYGAKLSGVTVHFVDEKIDHGPIILQQQVRVEEGDTPESFEARVHKVEHKLYPQAIGLFLEGKLKVEGRKVKITL
ncbi:MAG: phosphoribosylglycinamide formyltransferase [Candidatus Omnitrophica bacterium]|nr:phosphoribosylglycinamide formyltransferase [Candidatus Omnitrophota bacterium]MDD5654160.1 phosphoribosylglycinamide formyltransferase [Candidatus Omnitrophota bacterium]